MRRTEFGGQHLEPLEQHLRAVAVGDRRGRATEPERRPVGVEQRRLDVGSAHVECQDGRADSEPAHVGELLSRRVAFDVGNGRCRVRVDHHRSGHAWGHASRMTDRVRLRG